jgi:hypothetical protein
MRFADLETLLNPVRLGWPLHPGPIDLDLMPNMFIVATAYGGAGEAMEGLTDRTSWQVRVIGKQNDYTSAETMALAIDRAFLRLPSSRIPSGLWVVAVSRIGGPPSALTRDNAKRTHFICSYSFEHELALAV